MGFRSFRKAFRVVYENRHFSVFIFLSMLFFAVLGFVFPDAFPDERAKVLNEISGLVSGQGFFDLAAVIILNNLRAALLGSFLGVFFAVFPVLAVVVNGYFLGSVLHSAWGRIGGLSLLFVIPHGIFEIAALSVAFGFGVKLGLWFREKDKWGYIRRNVDDLIVVFLYFIVPLIVFAGFVESVLVYLI